MTSPTSTLNQLNAALGGRYSVEREIGAGGMAVVYLATDIKHHRKVALKVLNAELGAVLGVERFLAEIRVTANLQHPNLLPLFDSGEADGMLFYVMPFVDGESLRAKLNREKQLGIDEAIHIAVAVAGALHYAHQHGVIHRDLKPENILLQGGHPVLADFGIALAVSKAGGQRVTQTGISLGTPHYMSPEQATGDRQIDARTDIYSLGAVLYEMLTGEPPHTGNTAQAVIARLLTDRPRPVRASRQTVPPHIDAALECALAKLPADRFATAHDFAQAITGARSVAIPAGTVTPGSVSAGDSVSFTIPTRGLRKLLPWIAAAALVAIAAWGWLRPRANAEGLLRFTLETPPNVRVAEGILGTNYALSPDGRMMVFLANDDLGSISLYLRPIEQLNATVIPGTRGARSPVFSPDGQWIAFAIGGELKRVSAQGGAVQTLAAGIGEFGLSWGAPDIIVSGGRDLNATPAGGGAPRVIASSLTEKATNTPVGYRWPLALPDGKTVIFTSWTTGAASGATIAIASLEDGKIHPLGISGTFPLAYEHGILMYAATNGTIMAVPVDIAKRKVTGNAVPVVQDVILDASGAAKAAYAKSGDLVYLSGQSLTIPVLVDMKGVPQPMITDARVYSTPRYSPDGKRVALTVGVGNAIDIWVYDLEKGTLSRLTSDGTNMRPEWSPDGKRILFRAERQGAIGIFWQAADGSDTPVPLYTGPLNPYEGLLSPDGRYLVIRTAPGSEFSRDIFYRAMQGDTTTKAVVSSPHAEQMPRVSPDGKWIAYMSDESGQFEIYVRPFPGSGGRIQISNAGGVDPLWSRDGRMLYYRSATRVMGASVRTSPDFAIVGRSVLIEGEYVPNATHQNYDIAPDGRHFLMIRRAGGQAQTIIVHNWISDVRTRMRGR